MNDKQKQSCILLGFVLLISLTEVCAQYNIKLYNANGTKRHYCYGALLYVFIALLLSYSYNHTNNMGIVQILWSGISIALVLLVSRFIFGKTLKRNEIIGLALIFGGIILIQM